MIEKFLEMFLRLVVAAETIASILANESTAAATMKSAVTETAPATASNVVRLNTQTQQAAPSNDNNPFLDPDLVIDNFHHYWDEEIHTSVKSQNQDGSWKLKRGVDKALVEKKLKEQDYLFQLATGRNPTEAASNVGKSNTNVGTQDEEDEASVLGVGHPLGVPPTNVAAVPPLSHPVDVNAPGAAVPPPAIKVVRIPAHRDHTQFTKAEMVAMLEDCHAIHGATFDAVYSDLLDQAGRTGMKYADIDEAAVPWLSYNVMEWLKNV